MGLTVFPIDMQRALGQEILVRSPAAVWLSRSDSVGGRHTDFPRHRRPRSCRDGAGKVQEYGFLVLRRAVLMPTGKELVKRCQAVVANSEQEMKNRLGVDFFNATTCTTSVNVDTTGTSISSLYGTSQDVEHQSERISSHPLSQSFVCSCARWQLVNSRIRE